MEKLLALLKDGKSRTPEMLAAELGVSVEDVKRDIEFLERTGVIVKVGFSENGHSCNGCTGCGTGKKTCAGCMPEGGFKNMGYMWEVK
ncbi:MAG: Lrp/AsnC family transcriptional regulator [Lachnospiraceae bacterium]|nr:Lrp/AsnC family transcriptional regulator [Lachnospiraceae bacterium]